MFGIGWMEISMIMTVFTMVMVWIIVIISVVNKRRGATVPTPAAVAAPSQSPFPKVANLHLAIATLTFAVLMICAPLGWLLFGQAGMPLVRLTTIGILLAWLYVLISAAIVISTSKTPFNQWQIPNPSLGDHDPSMQVSLVARITQRFCPRCRAPLAADAPEGLCPACLMAGGLASAVVEPPVDGTAVTTPPSGSQPPTAGEWESLHQHFPQLEILELLGRGGMGAVYKARQKNLDRLIALKVIPPEAAKDPAFAERFAREARALARLNHPNIVTVHDFGQVGDVFYLLMEYVDGVNLRHALRANRLRPSEALAIVPPICDALQYAHDQGVVHRDIKPENILLDRSGRVKIADFGLAKMLGKGPDDFTLTHTQQVMGTPRYMAPEQIEHPTAVDHRADIYSLGVVFYEMLTGELPLGRFQPPSHKVQLDVRIDQVVLRALEKEPDRRYQRASQVKTELATAAPPTWHTPAPATKLVASADASREAIRHRVQAPAAGLIIAGFVELVCLAGFLLAGPNMPAAPHTTDDKLMATSIATAYVLLWIGLVPSLAMAIGGWQMWNLKSHGLAVTAAALAFLPCSPACVISLPMGIWALIVLFDRNVRAAFAKPASADPRHNFDIVGQTTRASGCVLVTAAAAIVLLMCAGTLVGLLLPAIQKVRESARQAQSMNNLKQIGLALHNYHDVYGSFPPAVVADADGKPLYSGRVLLLPFLDQVNLYNSFDLSQAWDSPKNLPVSQAALNVFMDPSSAHNSGGRTDYLFVVGGGTMFESTKSVTLSDVLDGTSNTMMMVEVKGFGFNWAEPVDLYVGQPNSLPQGNHPGVNLVLFGDGSVRSLPSTMTPSQVRALATIGGSEPTDFLHVNPTSR